MKGGGTRERGGGVGIGRPRAVRKSRGSGWRTGRRKRKEGEDARGFEVVAGERTGNLAVLLLHLRHLDADLLADLLGDGLAVDDGGVRAEPTWGARERRSRGRAGAAPEGRGRGDLPPEGGGGAAEDVAIRRTSLRARAAWFARRAAGAALKKSVVKRQHSTESASSTIYHAGMGHVQIPPVARGSLAPPLRLRARRGGRIALLPDSSAVGGDRRRDAVATRRRRRRGEPALPSRVLLHFGTVARDGDLAADAPVLHVDAREDRLLEIRAGRVTRTVAFSDVVRYVADEDDDLGEFRDYAEYLDDDDERAYHLLTLVVRRSGARATSPNVHREGSDSSLPSNDDDDTVELHYRLQSSAELRAMRRRPRASLRGTPRPERGASFVPPGPRPARPPLGNAHVSPGTLPLRRHLARAAGRWISCSAAVVPGKLILLADASAMSASTTNKDETAPGPTLPPTLPSLPPLPRTVPSFARPSSPPVVARETWSS